MKRPLKFAVTNLLEQNYHDKTAVHGAINTCWTLHKVELLQLKSEETKHRVIELMMLSLQNVKYQASKKMFRG